MADKESLIAEIERLRKERNAIILAHNYVSADIQQIADFCGDSLELSIKASKCDAEVLVVCGVRFMAETAKLLSPGATVLMVRPDAGCPMADMVDVDELKKFKAANPDTLLVAYVNTTAEVKSLVDICCTSGNAEKVVSSIPRERDVMFLPDRNLGQNMINKLDRPMRLWNGCCPIHDEVTVEIIGKARENYPGAEILVHPECRPEVVAAADKALSTGAMLNYVPTSGAKEFVVGTESGILFRMQRENPDKKFHKLMPELLCTDMKKLTLEDVAAALREMKTEVVLPAELAENAVNSIKKMLAL